jgi:hypothetical protein
MSPRVVQLLVAAPFAVLVWLGARAALGPKRRKDPVLLAGIIVATGALVGGAVGLVLGEKGSIGFLVLGVLLTLGLRSRWRRTSLPSGEA